jgi:uroporphyrinogen decarboxylase
MLDIENGKMTSRERVLVAFAKQEPDRVPVNYFANPGIDGRLKKHFGLKPEDNEKLLEILGVDFRGIYFVPYKGPRLHTEIPGINVDPLWGIHRRWVEHSTGGYWDYCDFPLKDADEDMIASWPMPSPDDFDYSPVPDICNRYEKYALCVGSPGLGDIMNTNGFLRGTEQTFIDLATNDPAGVLLTDRRLKITFEITARILEAGKGKIDFIWLGEDLGAQTSQLISLDLYRKFIKPRHQKFVDLAKSYNIPVMIHSCGSSSWAFEDFIEMGITAVDTLQPEAKNMSPEFLKKNFGGRLAFHGCISTAGPVAYGSVQDVISNVKETFEIMMPGGGYCMSPTHQLQDNSPTENVLAMYESAHKYGKY